MCSHFRGLPLCSYSQKQSLQHISWDYPHLLATVNPVHLRPPSGPTARKTRLGLTLQDPAKILMQQSSTSPAYEKSNSICSGPKSCDQTLAHEHSIILQLKAEGVQASIKTCYIPHHMDHYNGKVCIMFSCSFTFQGRSLNSHLLPGPMTGSTLLDVLNSSEQWHKWNVGVGVLYRLLAYDPACSGS